MNKSVRVTQEEWDIAIRTALGYRNKKATFDGNQMKVAEIAISVCQIQVGARVKNLFNSLAAFASAIGIKRNTLYTWVRQYKIVYSKLPKKRQIKITHSEIDLLNREFTGIPIEDVTVEEVRRVDRELTQKTPDELKWKKYLETIGAITSNFLKPIKLIDTPDETIEAVKEKAELLLDLAKKELELRQSGTNSAKVHMERSIDKFNKGIQAVSSMEAE